MFDDWMDPLDPRNPFHDYFWGDWVCPRCAEDGLAADLIDGTRCPHCGDTVEKLP